MIREWEAKEMLQGGLIEEGRNKLVEPAEVKLSRGDLPSLSVLVRDVGNPYLVLMQI